MAVEAASIRPDPGAEAGDAAAPAPAWRRRWILLAAPLLLGLAGAGLWFAGWLPHRLGLARGHEATGRAPPVTFAMPEIVANLASGDGTERYVKVDIRLMLASPAALAAVRAHLPELQDLFLTYLRDMHASELQSSIGTWRLREALLARAAIILGRGSVTDILFTNLLIQ